METLAIIAYRQPVTRGDIEEIRGVTVATNVVKTLEERGWIDVIGHRETPGRPGLYATTRKFLDDLGLRGLDELPPLDLVDAAMLDLPAAEAMLAGVGQAEANVITNPGVESAPPEAAAEATQPSLPVVEAPPAPAADQ
jgi:segregation and condensation protein B